MGNSIMNNNERLAHIIKEANAHLLRMEEAFAKLAEKYNFPLDENNFLRLLEDDLPLADQIIYRFSKTQDTIGAKLFRSFMIAQGDNPNQPFLDILNTLEKSHILMVEDWFALRDLRNEIAHNYDDDKDKSLNIINNVYQYKNKLKKIITAIAKSANIIT